MYLRRYLGRTICIYFIAQFVAYTEGNVRYRSAEWPTTAIGYGGDTCYFPFKYDGEYHFSCIEVFGGIDMDTLSYMWCSTTEDMDTDGLWSVCVSEKCQWSYFVPTVSRIMKNFYSGPQARTHSGFTCQDWSVDIPNYSPAKDDYAVEDDTLADAGNSCRNPLRQYMESICMVTNNFKPPFNTTEECNIPECVECNKEVDGTRTASVGTAEYSYMLEDGWCGDPVEPDLWLQIEFASINRIIGIIVKGSDASGDEKAVSLFQLKYSTDFGVIWIDYGQDINGNIDGSSQVAITVTPIIANVVRLYPLDWLIFPCMKVALFGCEATTGQCLSSPCQNGGVCEETNTGYYCDCPLEFTGETCETAFDPCGVLECYAGGTCVPSADGLSASCQCVDGFSGDHCQDSDVVYESCYDLAVAAITVSDYYTLNLYSDGSCELVETTATRAIAYAGLPFEYNIGEDKCKQNCIDDPHCTMVQHLAYFYNLCLRYFDYAYTSHSGGVNIFVKLCHVPRPVYCDFTDPDNPVMHILHNMPEDMPVNPDIYLGEISRRQVPIYFLSNAGIATIKLNSYSCSQSLEWKCLDTVLENSLLTFWDGDELIMDNPDTGCVLEDPVDLGGCACSTAEGIEKQDSTVFTNKDKLPIKMIDVEDANGVTSFVTLTLGPLKCVQPLIDLDECASSPCQNGGACTDQRYYYTCDCVAGYTGVSCEIDIDECLSQPCLGDGDCYDDIDSFTCQCKSGLAGDICEININDCFPEACQNGGSCVDLIDDYFCVCEQGTAGSSCEIELDECESLPCQNGGTCENLLGSFNCLCDGYEGIFCESEIDECLSNPCEHGGACEDHIGGFTCTCLDGYSGINCETDINECDSLPCQNGGICEDDVNGYICTCMAGFTSDNCETNLDDCGGHLCFYGAACVDGVNDYTCDCASGFSGDFCEYEIEECLSEPCQHDGRCVEAVNGYACECLVGYTGKDCEIDINECSSNPCKNGATCVDMKGRFFCECREGNGGDFCDKFVVDGQWGGWMGWTVCSSNCGTGIRTRIRECNNPNPQYGGEDCEGAISEGELCYHDQCDSIDGEWGHWGEWGRCSATCGPGTTERYRACEKLKGAGRPCQGDYNDMTYCKDHECGVAIDGRWSYWSPWSQCSKTCGISSKKRFRTCTDPPAVFGGKPCKGNGEDVTGCIDIKCPELEKCSEWSAWGACSTTCGDGTYRCNRTCTEKPITEEGTEQIVFERTEYKCEHCKVKDCDEKECYTCSSTYDGTVSSLQCKGPTMKCPADKEYCMYKFSKKGNVTGLTKSCASVEMCSESLTAKCISLRDQTIDGSITDLKQLKCSQAQPHPDTLAQLWRDIKEECRICCTSSRCNKGILPAGNTIYNTATSAKQQYQGMSLMAAACSITFVLGLFKV